ncbi:hypothetical protein SD70_17310 [Gordoniibacillus kamchatkensis]|uniref:Uncharacterized protein n=1 Tax=Gordoniibacillus kamchatkensis TaxID=1590651 RepID=A0ABR5AGI2_9BACL|nr:hypothetical protein SD70_17310 [Paenibacillus sp. VKM B-2647]
MKVRGCGDKVNAFAKEEPADAVLMDDRVSSPAFRRNSCSGPGGDKVLRLAILLRKIQNRAITPLPNRPKLAIKNIFSILRLQ